MKCRVCGAYNEDYMEYCENCAALLTPEGTSAVKSTATPATKPTGVRTSWGFANNPEWPEPEFDFNTVDERDIPQSFIDRAAGEQDAASYDDEPSTINADPFASSAFSDPVDNRSGSMKFADPIEDDNFYSYEKRAAVKGGSNRTRTASAGSKSPSKNNYGGTRSRGSRTMNKRTLLFWGVAGLLVVAIVVLAIVFLTGGSNNDASTAQNGVSQDQTVQTEPGTTDAAGTDTSGNTTDGTTTKKTQSSFSMFINSLLGKSPLTKPATIEKDTSSTDTAYLLTIYVKKGCTVSFTAGTLVSDNVSDGSPVKLRVPEQVWIPGEPSQESVLHITPNVVVIDKDGGRTQVEFDTTIDIALPTLTLNIISPTESPTVVQAATVEVSGTVDNSTAEVFVGDTQFSVDAEGSFTGVYTLTGAGTQTVDVEARKNGYAIARTTLTFDYSTDVATGDGTAAAVGDTGTPSFVVDSALERRTTASTLTVSGTFESGATLSVSGVDLNGTVTTDAAAGTFQFTVSMPEVGLYTAVITSSKNGIEGTRTLYLERSHEDKNAYMEGTHALDYQYLMDSPFHAQGYTIIGKVVEVIQASPFVIARMTTDAGDLIFYYYGTAATVEANDGKTYSIYGDPYGRYDLDSTKVPQVYAWYIKKAG